MTTAEGSTLSFTVAVTNTGTRGGAQTVLGFWRPRGATAAALHAGSEGTLSPLRQKLFAFDGCAHVRAGGSARLRFTLKAEHLAIADASGDQIVRAGDYEV